MFYFSIKSNFYGSQKVFDVLFRHNTMLVMITMEMHFEYSVDSIETVKIKYILSTQDFVSSFEEILMKFEMRNKTLAVIILDQL